MLLHQIMYVHSLANVFLYFGDTFQRNAIYFIISTLQ